MEIDIHIPCFADQLYPETGFNMVKVLEHLGCKINYNTDQTCCGLPAFETGHWDEAKEIAEKTINEFRINRPVVSLSGSCTNMVRSHYSELFYNSALHNPCKQLQSNTFEFSNFIVHKLKTLDIDAKFTGKIAYHPACSVEDVYDETSALKLLKKVRGIELVEYDKNMSSCGFGGSFSVNFEEISVLMAKNLVDAAEQAGAEYMLLGDLGCKMHLDGYIQQNNRNLKVIHLADLLAEGIKR